MGGPGKDTPACVGIVTAEVPPALTGSPLSLLPLTSYHHFLTFCLADIRQQHQTLRRS